MAAMVQCVNINKQYAQRKAMSNTNLKMEAGKNYGILGPNGSGKTTLMKIIADLHRQTSGEITICDQSPSYKTRALVAYMPTENFIYAWMRVRDAISFYDDMYQDFDRAKAEDLMRFMELDMKQKVSSLSTGQRARLKISLTLARRAQVYLLDEPLNGLDPVSRTKIKETIIEQFSEESTMLISTHLVLEIEQILDYVFFMNHGEIVIEGEAEALRMERGKSEEEISTEVFSHA